MSKFSKLCDNSIRCGLNMSLTDWDRYTKAEVPIGKFDSGYVESKKDRRIDRRIFTSDLIYGVSRNVDIEYQGTQHIYKRFWIDKYGPIEGNKRYNDQLARDAWQAQRAEEFNHICIWIIQPKYNSNIYDTQLNALQNKLSQRGYLTKLLQDCEKKSAKGVVIYWDHETFIINKSFPKYAKNSL